MERRTRRSFNIILYAARKSKEEAKINGSEREDQNPS